MNTPTRKVFDQNEFDLVSIKLASPERILEWSFGEVTKPETINYRTQRPERAGLFDEKIFGPEKDYECYCGKYRGIRYKGIVCEKCGVELTRSIVRRDRMGHIELATPVSHVWFLRGVPSRIALVMGIPAAELERVIYFAGYIVTKILPDERDRILRDLDLEYKSKVKSLSDEKSREKVKELLLNAKNDIESIVPGRVFDEMTYHRFSVRYGTMFEAGIGAETIHELCKKLDLPKLKAELEVSLEKAPAAEREKTHKRLGLITGMIAANIRPEWMFLSRIPVIPPALRPMVALDGGRHATSDLNDLYRRVINRNNRLRKLKDINAPDVILRNEKRILQEAVDSLIDNSIRHGAASSGAVNQAQRRPLKSLADNLKTKQGLFRQNLLGKRVDYSGRSVIVVGPDLRLDQCGLPKHMALELFRPFVIQQLLRKELAFNIRGANRLIDEGIPEVWAILEDVIRDKRVLLNRAPTLHRLGIQAFRPVLIEGNAIQVHPLVCTAFNADFDGDQMAVHVPLGEEAQAEAREIMAADKNILKPGSGEPTVTNKLLDIVLGAYWMTKVIEGEKGQDKVFASPNHAITAADFGVVSYRARIKVMPTESIKYQAFGGVPFETTVGRLLFNSVFPSDYPYLNKEVDRKIMSSTVDDLIDRYGIERVPAILDKMKAFGFRFVTQSGITWGIDDIKVPQGKYEVIRKAKEKSEKVLGEYNEGLLSEEEKYRSNIEIWHAAKNDIEKLIPATLEEHGSVYDMLRSGARGSMGNITQMVGMKGLIQNTAGETMEFPILSSAKEGLTPIEYFISTHGARKGLSDTALNTSRAGYLTRRLFDVAQDVVVSEEDCGTKLGTLITKKSASGIEISLAKGIRGRYLASDIVNASGETLFKRGHFLTHKDAESVEAAGVAEVMVRSPLTCATPTGICQKCYGADLGNNQPIAIGEAVGTVAAQAIGEPGTQLTMRTFHAGGTASVGGDITQGLPRVEEVFERRLPKNPAVISRVNGEIMEIKNDGKEKILVVMPDLEDRKGKKAKEAIEYTVHFRRTPLVSVGEKIVKGQLLTDGSADIEELFQYAGKEKTENYIIHEISKIYELQGASISRKHIEVIIRQMFSRRRVVKKGDTSFSVNEITDTYHFDRENARAEAAGGEKAEANTLAMGIQEVSLSRKSFLSAASFQHTTKILISAAVRGAQDDLIGLKENVIIGRLIPAGTGFRGSPKQKMIEKVADEASR
ncbi:DNA-directed RNA polymerase subunit beta' [Candidatus Parcubacteria bacterium]|nr:DNA-directed RNA polymerase subunit beta' [Candidatus Parcubacteria bacterium]